MSAETMVELSNFAYLIASVMFILGLKKMTHPRTAVDGNLMSAGAMLLAVIVTLASGGFSIFLIASAILVGGAIGAYFALNVEMTKMPELVALFNGFGGLATVLVAALAILSPELFADLAAWKQLTGGDYLNHANLASANPEAVVIPLKGIYGRVIEGLPIALSGIIGAVTFTGSLIAVGKLYGMKIFWTPIEVPFQVNASFLAIALGLGFGLFVPTGLSLDTLVILFIAMIAISLILGITLVLPIGGADMPVVVALLNSYSGLAAASAGFVVNNTILIIAGSLVGASGIILTAIMCKAMNRSLTNVLFGKIDAAGATMSADEVYEGKITRTSADEIAMLVEDANHVVIVPGYGMAVAQAQFAVRDFYQELEARGVKVDFAIHPVAGRMPGHMNVLLAEVDIPYDKLREMDDINTEFANVDVAIVLGANDVVNPDGRDNPDSPIAGMPILDVDKARTVVVIKRSLSPGFAGIPNPLFANDKTLMFFSDGKKAALEMVSAVKEL